MNRSVRWIPYVFLSALCAAAAPSLAQPVADKPDLKVGDQWFFRETVIEGGKEVNRPWMRRIEEFLPDEKMRVRRLAGIDTYDTSWNPIHPDRPEFWPLDFQFPLRVGAEWSFSSPPGKYWQHGHHKVVAYESITVPAGTFDCFRLEGVSSWNSGTDTGGVYRPEFKYNESWHITKWYCPAVKYVVKLQTERTATGVATGATWRRSDSELIHFAPVVDVSRYDGEWIATRACDAFQERPFFTDKKSLTVQGGEFVIVDGAPGQPGYSRISGRASENGTLVLEGTGVSNAAASRGNEYQAYLEGRAVIAGFALSDADDEGFALSGKYGARKCTLRIRRAGG